MTISWSRKKIRKYWYLYIAELNKAFDALDRDGDHKLNRSELAAMFRWCEYKPTRIELDFIFRKFDADGKADYLLLITIRNFSTYLLSFYWLLPLLFSFFNFNFFGLNLLIFILIAIRSTIILKKKKAGIFN